MPISEGKSILFYSNKVTEEISYKLGKIWLDFQVNMDYDYLHDPQASWANLLSPYYDMPGISRDYLIRYPKLNYFYWGIKVSDNIKFKPNIFKRYLCIEKMPDLKPRKISLFGPHTLYRSITYYRKEKLNHDAKLNIINYLFLNTLDLLCDMGYELFDFYEIWIYYSNIDLLSELYKPLRKRRYKYIIHASLINITTKFKSLLFNIKPYSVIIDIFENDLSKIKAINTIISLGVIDVRECNIEKYQLIEEAVSTIIKKSLIDTVALTNNTHLALLPPNIALNKSRLLIEAKRRLIARWGN